MECMLCKKGFVIKRKISEILIKQRYLICDKCYYEHPININTLILPLDNSKQAIIISILNEKDIVNHHAFMFEYSEIVRRYINQTIFLYDNLTINDKTINLLNILSKLADNNLIILTYRCRIV